MYQSITKFEIIFADLSILISGQTVEGYFMPRV